MSLVDLHIHSSVSDGKFRPSEIVRKANESGLRIISLSDHDAVDGIPEAIDAAQSYSGLSIIPGVEISTDVLHGEIHILGYYIDYKNTQLVARLKQMRESRVERARKMVDKLGNLGIKIEWSRVRQLASGSSVGRPHVAQAMLEKGYIGSFKEAFDRFIGREGPAYVERDKMTPAEAVKLIIDGGGLPAFAHPLTFPDFEAMVAELAGAGLSGIETYYKGYTEDEINHLLTLADKYNLIPTGGSDYHGIEPDEISLGEVEVPLESAERLAELIKVRELKGSY